MSEYANNIPTNDKVFSPMEGAEIPSVIADILEESPYADDDPARPVDDLIKSMLPQRPYLMAFLRKLAEKPATTEELEDVFRSIYRFRPIVFSTYDMCVLLEEAGGIARVDADGNPYGTDQMQPIMETGESGAAYYRAAEPADMYWKLTDAGQTILDDDDPVALAQKYFDADPEWQPLYKRLLTLCKDGADIQEINDAITYDDLLVHEREEDPERFYHDAYAAFFVDRMERAGAIDWTWVAQGDDLPRWKLTDDPGAAILALLDGVADSYDAKEQTANKERFLSMFEDSAEEETVEFEGTLIDEAAIKAAHVNEASEEGANYLDPPTRTD